jgi:hypothetical protein
MEKTPAKTRIKRWLIGIPASVVLLFILYTWISLNWSYADGERAGYVQKFSKKGWLFKTWEGELAMVNMPGTAPEKFYFSVPEDSVADAITKAMGRRVSLSYEQHKGIPVSWYAETEYFVVGVRVLE